MIGRHGSMMPVGVLAAEVAADAAFRRHVRQLHALGPRPIGELLAELGRERAIQHIIDKKLERYAHLDPDAVRALRGWDWPDRT